MDKAIYQKIDTYMLTCMEDSAHDKDHIYRVLYTAMDIAEHEENVNAEILIASCLLHDIGRKEQFETGVCHAKAGADKAYRWLTANGFSEPMARAVRECIRTHRFRGGHPPVSLEARILFDADKLDVIGTLGIARTLMYNGEVGDPLYSLDDQGRVLDGSGEEPHSFFREYRYKLANLHEKLFTRRAREIADARRQSAARFYESMLREVRSCYGAGMEALVRRIRLSEAQS